MKPQSAAFLEKARALLEEAETMLRVDLNDAAGRTAYLAGFHAAQALIFEAMARVGKTHSGVRSEFARLVKNEPRLDNELRGFLGYAYQLKEIADYELGSGSKVSAENARAALLTARRFVACVEGLLPADG
ncbi:HEPN domain-containing protein [Methylocystis bryophila]|uniref:HEPN domain-containing protein n=1 Tax=Methylocystis bryophila TaxID=655015 RepID=A0A1W6MVD6_9HYPH|nr:HEPN domain-containing protein [Methylocystis bryophila]ARN81573.1 hypothetical protein B1812_11400 [Methylocystis bryophila]BDV37610.1 hypothetical protein DSM21852_08630 [Methylocystis bryophila]